MLPFFPFFPTCVLEFLSDGRLADCPSDLTLDTLTVTRLLHDLRLDGPTSKGSWLMSLLQNVQVEIATWHCIHTVDIFLSCYEWCIACLSSRSMLGLVCYLCSTFMCYVNHSGNVYWNGIFILKLISIYLTEWFIYSRPSSPHLQLKRLMRYCWWKGQMDGGR